MARQDASIAMRKPHPQRKLQYLLNETYARIDELKELIRKESSITGSNIHDTTINRMFSRQDYLVTLCAEICNEQEKRNAALAGAAGTQAARNFRPSYRNSNPASTAVQPPNYKKAERDESKVDGSWYGSLDRSLAKKRKNQIIDKRRRHTKTIGSMAGLDVIKKSAELQPDEQYELGLPAAPKIVATRSSIFPMTQHQYYTALMDSKMGRKHAYPLDVRPVQQVSSSMLPPPLSTWGHPMESLDENKNMKKHMHQHSAVVPTFKPNVVPLPCRSLGNEITFRHSGKSNKKWYETNLDECPTTPTTTQNTSPSPSISTRGSSRGSVASGMDTIDGGVARMAISSPANESAEFNSKSSESSESWSGTGNEVTKPFEMSDYYKYSTKFRSRNSPVSEEATSPNEARSSNGLVTPTSTIGHFRYPSQIRQEGFEASNGHRDTNGNPSVGPKLPPKQRRNQNKSISSSSVIYEGDMMNNGDPSKEVWITNKPTFV